MPAYALGIVYKFAEAVGPALHDEERPRLVEIEGVVRPADVTPVARPGTVSVFINPAHRMVVLRGDEYRADLCRKINESRYGPPYYHAPVMGSENGEDATTWTFLRTLERRCRPEWVIRMVRAATGGPDLPERVDRIGIRYWFGRVTDDKLPVPPGVNETATELDALIEFYSGGRLHLVAVEAKVTSPFSGSARDQFVRVIDVGSYYAATRYVDLKRFWAVAILPEVWEGHEDRNPHQLVARYQGNPQAFHGPLGHRLGAEQECGRLTDQDVELLASHIGAVSCEQLIEIARATHDVTRRDQPGPWP